MNHNTYDYRKNQSYTTYRPTTAAIGGWLSQWQEPRIPYALSRTGREFEISMSLSHDQVYDIVHHERLLEHQHKHSLDFHHSISRSKQNGEINPNRIKEVEYSRTKCKTMKESE